MRRFSTLEPSHKLFRELNIYTLVDANLRNGENEEEYIGSKRTASFDAFLVRSKSLQPFLPQLPFTSAPLSQLVSMVTISENPHSQISLSFPFTDDE